MKNRKRKLLKFGIVALMPILALLLCLHNTYAYYFDNNDNLVSNNLLDITLENGSQNGISYSVNNGRITLNGRANNYVYIVIGTTQLDGTYYISGDRENVQVFMQIAPQYYHNTSFTYTGNLETRLEISPNVTFNNYVIEPMLNVGTIALDFEPFGVWYNQNDYNDIKNKLDTINTGMLNYLDYIEFSINGESIEINGDYELTYQDLVDNNLLYNDSTIIINAFDNSTTNPNLNPVSCSIYFNNLPSQLIALLFSGNGFQFNVNIYGNGNIFSRSVNDENNTITQIDNSNIISIDQISFTFIGDTLSYISFSDYNSIYYENGYQNGYSYGYQNGKIEGSNNGYNEGYISGYNDGYNEGVEDDLSTSGFRILITTILSYPVNMVRESLNFEFMGIHIASVVMFVISLGIVAFVIKRFKD